MGLFDSWYENWGAENKESKRRQKQLEKDHQDEVAKFESNIHAYLVALGGDNYTTRDRVTKKLQAFHITGKQNSQFDNPIARYLNVMLEDWREFEVKVRYDPGINQTLEVMIGLDLFVFWDLRGIVGFLDAFDRGDYPSLIEIESSENALSI